MGAGGLGKAASGAPWEGVGCGMMDPLEYAGQDAQEGRSWSGWCQLQGIDQGAKAYGGVAVLQGNGALGHDHLDVAHALADLQVDGVVDARPRRLLTHKRPAPYADKQAGVWSSAAVCSLRLM